ncbi:LANO_0A05732g1_1 [Lachancea nothofagi CBS 11611]|uniref:LANO_0A05732g1_1 n=1 Tax=Lachancea nothofagi CBS 11611 TaxID=1266666 RepID=A0A1G4IRC2_9SACH|nr:LANO_0A05732g1_1 [Lachancea nothofagi CBS 11611]
MARDPENHNGADERSVPAGRRRRRKVVRSCTFCRQRKLKCDQQKPMCGSCRGRKLPECVYTNGFNFQLTSDELFSSKPNVTLIRRIQELEEALERASLEDDIATGYLDQRDHNTDSHNTDASATSGSIGGSISGSSTSGSGTSGPGTSGPGTSVSDDCPMTLAGCDAGKNLVSDFHVLRSKDGRYIYYGPTSIRAVITASGDRFVAEYSKVWRKVKTELDAWKDIHGRLLTMDYSSMESTSTGSLIESVIPDLPAYETIESKLHEFFNDPLHTYFQFMDKDKVLHDFSRCFIPGYLTRNGSDSIPRRQVAMLITQDNKNFFTIGVVMLILCLNHYKTNIPASLQRLCVSLIGFTTSKSVFVERAQFLLLVYIFRVYNGLSGNGSSHLISLTSLLCTTAMNLGLHKDIDKLYGDQTASVGSLSSLKNLWYWTLFADLNVSFDIGSPPFISQAHYDDSKLPTMDRGRIPLLRKFLHVGRKCLHIVFDRTRAPSMLSLVSLLTSFMELEFRPLRYYTNPSLISEIDLFEIMILSPTLAMMTNFYNLTRVQGEPLTIKIKNGFVKSMLIATSVAVNAILRCYSIDEQRVNLVGLQQSKVLTPSLNLCVLLLNSLPIRTLTEIYGLMFYKITLFEKGLIISMDEGLIDGPTLDDFSVPDGLFLSFRGIFKTFCSIFDELWKPENARMTHMLWNSHYFVIMMALERVNRTVFQMGLDSRTQVEVTHNWSRVGNDEVPDDIVKMLADEVWNNYSTGFTDLIEMDAGDFLTDFDMLNGE